MKKKQILSAFLFLITNFFLKSQELSVFDNLTQSFNLAQEKSNNLDVYINFRTNFNALLKNTTYEGSHFVVDQLRLEIIGNVNKDLAYYFRQRLNASAGPGIGALDGLSKATDFAYVSYKFNDQFLVQVGKQAIVAGGMEYDKNGLFVYKYADLLENMDVFFTGINLSYKPIENHEIQFQLLNNSTGKLLHSLGYEKDGVKVSFTEKDLVGEEIIPIKMPLIYTLNWNGKLFNERIKARNSYSFFEDAKDKFSGLLSLGVGFEFYPLNIELDYMFSHQSIDRISFGTTFLREKNKGNNDFDKKIAFDTKYNTGILNIGYKFLPKWNFLLKGIYETASSKDSRIKVNPNNAFRISYGYQGGVEFMPLESSDKMKIYLMYIGQKIKYSCNDNVIPLEYKNLFSFGLSYQLGLI